MVTVDAWKLQKVNWAASPGVFNKGRIEIVQRSQKMNVTDNLVSLAKDAEKVDCCFLDLLVDIREACFTL